MNEISPRKLCIGGGAAKSPGPTAGQVLGGWCRNGMKACSTIANAE